MGQQKSKNSSSVAEPSVPHKNSGGRNKNAKQNTISKPSEMDMKIVPNWITADLFAQLLKQNLPHFHKITKFLPYSAMSAGENYASLMLRIEIDAELEDGTLQQVSYVMKVPHEDETSQQMMAAVNLFNMESEVYFNVLPELEALYRTAGKPVCFAPRAYKFANDTEHSYMLLEDLRPRGFHNADRFEGLDVEHAELVLKRLGQYHAASAYRVATKGPYSANLTEAWNSKEALQMFTAFFLAMKEAFLPTMKSSPYYEELVAYFSGFDDELQMMALSKNSQLNVLNHGDCWVNNILFQYNSKDKLADMIFVDFQIPMYGTPAQDFYYFLFSSVKLEYKLKYFDHFVRCYYDSLTESLKLLQYPKKIPSLRALYTELIMHDFWAMQTCLHTLPIVLLKTKKADATTMENLMAPTEEGRKFRNTLFSSETYQEYMRVILPWMQKRGMLQSIDMPPAIELNPSTRQVAASTVTPDWVNEDYFIKILNSDIANFKEIKKMEISPATNAGDNYSSIMLQVDFEVKLENGSLQPVSYMLKIAPSDSQNQALHSMLNSFGKETHVYQELIPLFEQVYRDIGLDVVFGPKSFKPTKDVKCDALILQNLRRTGFKNANRLEGLDEEHVKWTLTKLAQFHAVSAYVNTIKGNYPGMFDTNLFREEYRTVMEPMGAVFFQSFISAMKKNEGSEEYIDKLVKNAKHSFDRMLNTCRVDAEDFNVLNHGDCWTNNIMYQYDADGKITNMYFIDFQLSKYGSPAQDLYYFLLSSCALDIKVEKFEYFIKFYHDALKQHLELLKYPKAVPTLKQLHADLFKYGEWGIFTVNGVMAAALLDPTEDAQLNAMVADSKLGEDFRCKMFANDRYRKHATLVLKWLNERGLLDAK